MNRVFRVASILAILFVLSPLQSFATHMMGGEITWRCLSDGRYVFQFSVYRDCSGAALAPRGPLVIFNYPNVGQSTTLATQAQYNANPTIDRDISPECRPGGATFSCAGGDDESVFEYIRESDPVRLFGTPPAQGWIITYDDVARNDNENLQGQPGMTLRAKIFPFSGSVADTCVDNSPDFREEATSLLCLGSAFTYNHNASDVELDSLVYNWARPLDDVNPNFAYNEGSNPTFISYDPGYGSGLPGQPSPFPDQGEDPRNVPAVLNSSTGEISLTSFTSGKFVSVVQVDAYKCGEKVAEIYRELQSNINANCTQNEDPILRPPFNSFTSYRDTVRAGDLVTFNLQITDFPGPNNPNSDSVFVTATGFQWGANFTNANAGCANPPCATLSRPLPDSGLFAAPNNTFTWQTDCNHVAFTDGCVSLENTYNFVIRATDDACPIPGQTIATVSITVLADSVIESPLINCVDALPNGDVNLDWNTTPDPNNSFTAWMIYSATNENGPYTIIDSVKTYNQTTYTHSGAGADNQRRWYYIRSRSGCKGIVQNVARDTVSTLFVQPTLDQTCVGISWNSLSDPNNPAGSANSYRIFREYPIGTGMNFLQNSAVESFCDNFTACEDSVAYRIELVNTVEACTSRSNVIGFRFDRKPQTNFTVPATTCSGPVNFTNLTTAIGGNLSYTWDFGDGSPTSNQINPSHTFIGNGPFTVSLTASTGPGCDSTFTQLVNLGPDVDAGADIFICPGGNVTLGGFPTTNAVNPTFNWSPSIGLSSTTVSNPTATPTVTTTYTVVVTDQNSCTSSDQVVVTVNPLPFADAGTNQNICEGETATLGGVPTGPAGAVYQWDNAGTLNDATSANPIANPIVTTTYNVTVTSGVNCSATDQVTITVDPLPTANAGTDQNICPGNAATLGTAALPGLSYSWDNTASLNNGSAAQPTATPTVTTTYTVVVTDGNGCTNTDQVTITVDPLPTADAGLDQNICIGQSIAIGGSPTAPVGATSAWDNAASLSSATIANPVASPTATTTYTVTVTDGNGCSATDQITITVNPLPTADAGADQTICEGESATLGGAPTGPAGATYAWDNAGSLDDATLANPTATPTVTTTYTVTVIDGAGCSATDQITITVNPTPNVDAGPDQSICSGGSVSLGGSPTSSTAGVTYAWDNAASLDDATIANPTATPTVTTTYTVTVNDLNGCTATDQITITVGSLPDVDAGADQSICSGESATLGGSPTSTTAGVSFTWDNAGSLDDATLANPTATPTVTTTYTVTVSDGAGCSDTDQITITVDPLPTVDAGADQAICAGENITLGGSPTSTTVGATYAWDNAASLDDATLANPTATPTVTTTYTVTVSHPNGCTITDQITITVDPLPTVDAGADQAICIGGSATLGGSPTGPVGATYAWDNAASLDDATLANPTATPTVTTTYTVTVTDGNSCSATDQITITVNPLPTADAGADQTICAGESATLGGAPTGPAGATYAWDNAGSLDDATLANPTATPTVTTTYTVTVNDGAGCSATDQITIIVNPTPNVDAGPDLSICSGGSVSLGGSPTSSTAGVTYAWDNAASLDDATIANPTATPTVTTTYTVTVNDLNGCTATDQITITVGSLPDVDAGADQSICSGESATLGGSPTSTTAGVSFTWDNAGSLDDATLANPTATPTVTTTYTVTVSDGAGCSDTDQITITVDPLPTVDAGADQAICAGENITLGGSPTSTTVGATYAWDNAASLDDATLANPTATPTVTTTYTVTVSHPNGCTITDQITITVDPLPTVDAGADQAICIGGSATLGGSPTGPVGSTYAWDNVASLDDATLANPTATPTATTTYTVTVTDGNGCSATDQITITVNPLPTADAGADQTICAGESATLGGAPTGPAGATYAWDNAGSLDDATLANPTATPTVTTTYTVTVIDGAGCSATDQITITVNPLPNVDAGADQAICAGESIGIGGAPTSSTLGVTYAWDNATSLDDATIANPTAAPTVTTTYTVVVTDGTTGCTSQDQIVVTVNPLPTVDAGADQAICIGGSATLGGSPTGPAGSTYAWDNAGSLDDATLANPTATPTVTTTYTVTVTDGNGCSATDQIIITVNPLPTADAGADQTICAGASATLGGAPTGPAGATYAWDNGGSLDDATLANPTATPTVTTTYTVTVTDGNGCSATDQITITVDPLPTVDAGADQAICIGGSATLGGSPTGPVGSTYAWDNVASLDDATLANPTATPTATTTYTVTVTDGNGCSATDQITITVNPLPTADAGADQTICAGESATLGGAPTGPAGATYAWDNAGSLDDATLANPTATPTVTTTYTVTVIDGAGCSATDQITITVNPLPNVDSGADQAICAGESIGIGGAPTSSTLGVTYAWDNATSLDDATIANPTAAPTVTTTYTVVVTDGTTGCTSQDQIVVTVNPLPTVDAGADQAICIGGSATLGGSPTGPAGSTYAWDNAGSLDDATLANPTATPTVTTTYTVTVTDGNGCSATDQIIITVNPLPTADAGADQTICAGASATLGGAPTGPAGATYAWDNGGSLDDATLANPTATPTVTTTYTVTVTDGNGCSATDQITITVDPLPTVDAGTDQAICVGGSVSLGGSPTSSTTGATYAWDNAASLDDATLANPTATPIVTTTYTVTVTHPNGCTATDQIIITVNALPSADAGVDATICSGASIALGGSPTGPPASTYIWDNAVSLDDATIANPTATPTTTTTYTVTVTDVNGCTNTDQVTITVDPLPNVDAGPDRTICDLQSTPIGGAPTSTTVGATYAWDNAASLNDPAVANPVASPRTTTTYTLTVTHPNGCTDTDQVVVTVNPLPTVDAGADQAICIGSSTNLGGSPSGPAGSSFAWDNAASLNDATIANPIASPTVTTTYTLTVTDVNGCVNTDQVTITVNPLPIADAGLDRTICEADTVPLGTSTNLLYTYLWDNAATLDDNTLAQPNAFPSVTTTYTVTVTETATSCTSTDQVVISVLPQPFANAGSDDTLCLGESVILGGSPTGPAGATFAWDNAASLSDPAVSNPTAAPQTTTTYTVTVTDAVNGCTNTAQVTIVVNPLPTVDAGADQDICLGDSITLGGSPTGPIGAIYSWDNAASLDDATAANPLAFPTDTTTYTVLVTDTNGCVSTDQIVINVVPAPNVDAGFDHTICLGDSVSIGGTPSGPVGANYDWQPSSGLSDNTVPNPLASPSDTTIYILTVTASSGCISTDTVVVNVNAVPEANFGVDQRCISDLAAFSDSSTISIGSIVAWNWEFGDGTGVSSQQNPAYQYAIAGVYDVKLKVTSLDGCVDSVVKTVTINDLPLAVAGPDTSLCIGDIIQIGDQASFNPNVTYAWSPATEITDVNAASPMVFPLSTTNYFLSVTDQNGCVNFDTVEVSVNPLPIIQATADTSVCSFLDLQLNATGGDTYLWSPADYLDNPTLANPIARAEKSIQYVVLGTDLNGCESTDTVNVEVFNVDFQSYNTSVCARDSIQLMPVLQGDTVGISYNWSPDLGLSSSTLDSPMVAPPFTQEYKLRVRNSKGCTDVDSILVEVKTNANVRFDYVNSARCSGSVLEIENTSTNTNRFLWKVNGLPRTEEYNPKLGINNADTNIITLIGWNQNCSDSIQVLVEPATFEEILQYKGTNVFTPNGDGINDIFDPGFEGEFIGCADFRVYDRWGEKVFDSNIGQYGWDGRTLRGRVAPAGVYYYVIIVAGREVKGSVLLSR